VFIGANGKEVAIHFRDEQRGARAHNRWDLRQFHIAVSLRSQHIDESLAATDVDATEFSVNEDIVRITAGIGRPRSCRRRRVYICFGAPLNEDKNCLSMAKYTPLRGRLEKLRLFNALDQRGQFDM